MVFTRTAWMASGALLLSALMILWLGHAIDIDLLLADQAFDKAAGIFPMRHAWLAEQFNHVILKRLLSALAAGFIVLALRDTVWPYRSWSVSRRTGIRVAAMAAVLVPSVISLLKQLSTSHCPWDLQRYGGTEPYLRLLEWTQAGTAPGHCMPAGHASSALWLVSVAAFWWPHSRRKALAVATVMLVFGMTVGWIQQLRGAHFLTHTLWSAWIACAMVVIIYSSNVRANARGLARSYDAGYNSVPAATQT
ncbi:phosphatase PAP2 family protein [Pseudoduganella umbonata]|uniref:Membrane-associated PAP2 superfamily phosphatase n=1 Tax=Pseudoduganella umbonata TaxID=864828 RepID=A0A4P8HXH7_9BURK|nr:phosphatase PAP2 family protein [Pseudoduganella umbonata]MBB3225372.1 membrane-associated PAP2 superfamily phosphatase [Pseudoduganella umbonata]QCP13234.1 phosphatase PAP2 family protein [Pseudoduganella umbonata]